MTLFEMLTKNAEADTELLRSNDSLGDNFSTPREVDFAFETADRERADDFAAFVNGKQYGLARIDKPHAEQYRVVVLITMPINQQIVCSVSGFMLCLSRLFQIDYLGWGSVVQHP